MMSNQKQSWLASLLWDGSDQLNDGPRATSAISVAAARVGEDAAAAVIPFKGHNTDSPLDSPEGSNSLISADSSAASSHWSFSAATDLGLILPKPRTTQSGSAGELTAEDQNQFVSRNSVLHGALTSTLKVGVNPLPCTSSDADSGSSANSAGLDTSPKQEGTTDPRTSDHPVTVSPAASAEDNSSQPNAEASGTDVPIRLESVDHSVIDDTNPTLENSISETDDGSDVEIFLSDASLAKSITSGTSSGTPGTGATTTNTVKITGTAGIIFNITFDSSVSTAPAGFKTVITDVATFFANELKGSITVNLNVGWGEVAGQTLSSSALGQSYWYYAGPYSYSQIRSALTSSATSIDDTSAIASLPSTDPTNGGKFLLTTAQAKSLGLLGNSTAVDGYIGLSSSVSWAMDPYNRSVSGSYDLFGTAAHEISEVLGRFSLLGATSGGVSNAYSLLDLFRYSGSGTRSLTSGGYFSLNGGITNLDNFNTNSGGDLGDWAASAGNDSYLAFASSGTDNLVSESDLRVMDGIGWNSASPYTGVFSADNSTLMAGSTNSLA
jgi:hypothetical protein